MRKTLSLILVAGLIAAGTAQAQEAISTAKAADTPPAPPPSAAPISLSKHSDFDDEGPPLVGPCGAVGAVHDGIAEKPDKKVHGQVFAGVGTAGYREVGGAVCIPVGDHAAVSIAVDYGRIGH